MIIPTHEIEKMALEKRPYLFRYTRSGFNYNLLLTTNVFDITDHFFKNSLLVPAWVQNDAELMARIGDQIQSRFSGIEDLAADFYISTTKLVVGFTKTFSTTPLIYFRKLHMMYAQEILQTRQITVTELALELGFKSLTRSRYCSKATQENSPTKSDQFKMTTNLMPCVAIVDDNLLVRHTTQHILSLKSIPVIFEAENGQECIEIITNSLKKPDIIILDLDMPVMNGFQTAAILKASWPEIKIIAFSGTNDPAIIQKSYAAGADHFFQSWKTPCNFWILSRA